MNQRPKIASMTEFTPPHFETAMLMLVWRARELLGGAEDPGSLTDVRVEACENAMALLSGARALTLLHGDSVADHHHHDLIGRAVEGARAAIADGRLAERYESDACKDTRDVERRDKRVSIFRRAAETARHEAHWALTALCEAYPDSVPTEDAALTSVSFRHTTHPKV